MTAPPVPPNDEQLERQAASDELPVVGADGDECLTSAQGMPTQIAPPIPDDDKPPTVAAPYAFPEAYSQEPPEPVRRLRVAWRDAVQIAAVLAGATAVGLGVWVLWDQHPSVSSPPSTTVVVPPPAITVSAPEPSRSEPPWAMPSAPTASTRAEPPPPPSPPQPSLTRPESEAEKDQRLIRLANQAGVTVTDVPGFVRAARHICVELDQGASKQDEAAATMWNSHNTLVPQQAVALIDANTQVYCPSHYYPWVFKWP